MSLDKQIQVAAHRAAIHRERAAQLGGIERARLAVGEHRPEAAQRFGGDTGAKLGDVALQIGAQKLATPAQQRRSVQPTIHCSVGSTPPRPIRAAENVHWPGPGAARHRSAPAARRTAQATAAPLRKAGAISRGFQIQIEAGHLVGKLQGQAGLAHPTRSKERHGREHRELPTHDRGPQPRNPVRLSLQIRHRVLDLQGFHERSGCRWPTGEPADAPHARAGWSPTGSSTVWGYPNSMHSSHAAMMAQPVVNALARG